MTRRLYRSGESEYLIDGTQCRLRDVHELLMDTGLGAKAYSIIEQGKIGMILSSRPTDRRQLIEEAAGITKYKARRRAAELKLDAAQQNLTRLDDIVFEVEKQCGSLKRQAGRARRFQRLRDEMRRWEKVLFARRYRHLAEHIESARARLASAREDETASTARLSEVETELARVRIELAQAEQDATRVREAAHARELDVNRRQQQLALDAQQASMLEARAGELDVELAGLEERREPDRLRLDERRAAMAEAARARDAAADGVRVAAATFTGAQAGIERAEQDVERSRGDVYAVINTVTALTTAIEHAAAERERTAGLLARLDVEAADLRTELGRAVEARDRATRALQEAQSALHATLASKAAHEADLAAARGEHERRERAARQAEQDLAGQVARLGSLEEMDTARAAFGEGARMLLAGAHDAVGQHGALADYLDVDPRYERAVEAVLGDLLQHVVVDHQAQAHAGFALVRSQGAGRCGFIVTGGPGPPPPSAPATLPPGRGAAAGCRPGERAVRQQPEGGDRRRRLRRLAGPGRGAGRDHRAARGHHRRRCLSGRPRGQRRDPQRSPRHPGDQARDQGPARDGVERPRCAGRAARRDRPVRHGDEPRRRRR